MDEQDDDLEMLRWLQKRGVDHARCRRLHAKSRWRHRTAADKSVLLVGTKGLLSGFWRSRTCILLPGRNGPDQCSTGHYFFVSDAAGTRALI